MPSTIKDGPYEILLRFNCEPGEKFGALRGCHRVMLSYAVDETGIITGRMTTAEDVADFPVDQVQKFLGDNFAIFVTQIEAATTATVAARDETATERDSHQQTQAALTIAQQQIASHEATIATLRDLHIKLIAAHDALAAKVKQGENVATVAG